MFCHLIRVQQTSVWTQGSIFEFVHFAPRFCSRIFNQFNIMKHLAEWQFCSWVSITPMKELCSSWSVSGENEQGAKPVYWPTFTLAHLLGLWKTVSGMTYDDQTTRQTGLQVLPIYHLKWTPRDTTEKHWSERTGEPLERPCRVSGKSWALVCQNWCPGNDWQHVSNCDGALSGM